MGFNRFISNSRNLQKVLDNATRRVLKPKAVQTLAVAKTKAGSAIAPSLRYTANDAIHQTAVARVGSNDPKVLYAEEGTRPHVIRPQNGRSLKFPGSGGFGGSTVHAAVVYHPGTKGKHFLRDAGRDTIR